MCNVSRIFRHIHKVTHTEAYLPTLGFRLIQDPAITGSSNVKQHLLFKSSSSFKSLSRSCFHCFKSKHSTFFSSGYYFNNNNKNDMPLPPTSYIPPIHTSMLPTVAHHPHHPCKHATQCHAR